MGNFIKRGNFYLCSACKETEDSCTCELATVSLHDMEHWETATIAIDDDITDDAYHTRELFEDFDYDEFDMLCDVA